MKFQYSIATKLLSLFSTVLAAAVLVSCSSMPPISTDVEYCCKAGAGGIRTYRVEFSDTPEFLKPMLRDESSLVLDAKGLQYTEGDADAVLNMTYVHRLLAPEDEERDDFSEALSPGGSSKWIAEVHLTMKNSVTSELIWSGSMSRFHNASVGSFMHDAPARAAMRSAFMEMFADYPNPRTEDD